MRQLYILICLLTFSSVSAFGQFWNKTQAKYTFQWTNYFGGNNLGFKQLTIDSDTLINGKLFTRYYDYSVSYLGGFYPFDSTFFDTTSAISELAFYEEDSILYGHRLNYYLQDVDTLYNFKALPGESWTLPQELLDSGLFATYYCDSIQTVTVLDTGHILFQNTSLYYLFVEYSGFKIYYDTSFITTIRDTIFERFGSKYFSFISFPDYCINNFADGVAIFNLSCYSDNEISFGQNCTYLDVYTSVNEVNKDKFLIYPNPSNTLVRIQTRSKQIYLTDILGKVLFTVTVNDDNADIDVSGLTDGVYFLTTSDGYTNKLIVRH